MAAVREALSGRPDLTGGACPRCGVGLVEEEYEGTQVERCASCGGSLVNEDRVNRILVRREAPLGLQKSGRGGDAAKGKAPKHHFALQRPNVHHLPMYTTCYT